LIYINDLETSIEAGRPTTFADDTSIFITGNNANDVKNKINATIDALTNWCEMNRLIINKEKTVAISFRQPQKVQVESPQVKMQDTVINYTEHIKFLGLWLDKNIKWSMHTQQLATKLCKICFAIRVIKRVSGLKTVRTLYCAYFHSYRNGMEYGLIFWGNSANEKLIFRLQKTAIRAMVQIPKNISCKQFFKSLHILPLPSLYIHEIHI
jgi:hypothetical protein